MKYRLKIPLTFDVVLRVIADLAFINVSVLLALLMRFLYLVVFEPNRQVEGYPNIFWKYVASYTNNIGILMGVCLVVFSLYGFYTHGRYYSGRYKAFVVFQAVSLAYLLFGFLSYFFGGVMSLPRGALAISWGISVVILVAARLWAFLWSGVMRAEASRTASAERDRIRKLLVIGGAGYIGSALLPKLLEKGYQVRLFDLLLYGTDPIQHLLDNPNLEIMRSDFRQVDKVTEAMRGVDAVVHLGGIVGDPACALDEALTIDINLMATRMIAEVAKGSGVERFIFASSCSVYGASDIMLDEHSELHPVSLYARSKIASERVLHKLADEHFVPVVLRFGTIYGLSGRTRFDLVVNLLTAKAVVERQITLFGGDQWRPFLHVDDAAQAILVTLEVPLELVRGQVFNVGSNEQNYTIRQVAETIHRLVPEADLMTTEQTGDRRNYRVNFSKIRQVLNFSPRWTVEEGVRQVIQALRSGRVEDYQDARYSNVKFLNEEGLLQVLRIENGWAYKMIDEVGNFRE